MKKNEVILLGGWLCFLLFLLLLVTSVTGCSSHGWVIGGYEISPSDSAEVPYLVILDQDSVQHWYRPTIEIGDNYCYKHNLWEDVRKTSE